MGELIEYYVILATVEYVNDPLKMGRVKCNIPGINSFYKSYNNMLSLVNALCSNFHIELLVLLFFQNNQCLLFL